MSGKTLIMENTLILTDKQKELIERLGVIHEGSGFPPAASRVSSLLLVSSRPELTFDEIREGLNLSKSACSNAINLLLNLGRVEYITKHGDRKRYFRNKVASWQKEIKSTFKKMSDTSVILDEVLAQRPGNTTDFNQSLKELISFMNYLKDELPLLYAKWEKTKK